MKLNSKIVEIRWDDAEGIWNITIENPQTKEVTKDWAHVVVNGTGTHHFFLKKFPALMLHHRHPQQLEVA